ncbi:MAG: multicomponent Na+:H+ antiporter subunit F [Psychromonas sp.]|jgi:multicomponent Na+:H+ antiporter subunit F|uniref:monovalent cation/H+ antiporter complex subunit F n=1 Tax=Psychromonas sp. TaxID=1884585 RepID=UPI0039E6E625
MNTYLIIIVLALAVLLLLSLLYILRAASYADCLLSTQLVSTIGVAMLAILSVIKSQPYLLDVALVLALLTSITVVIFTQLRRNNQ